MHGSTTAATVATIVVATVKTFGMKTRGNLGGKASVRRYYSPEEMQGKKNKNAALIFF